MDTGLEYTELIFSLVPLYEEIRNQVLKWYFIELRWSWSHIVSILKLQSYNCLCLFISTSSLLNYKGKFKGNPEGIVSSMWLYLIITCP